MARLYVVVVSLGIREHGAKDYWSEVYDKVHNVVKHP